MADYPELDQTTRSDIDNRLKVNTQADDYQKSLKAGLIKDFQSEQPDYNVQGVGSAIQNKINSRYQGSVQSQQSNQVLENYKKRMDQMKRAANQGIGMTRLDQARYQAAEQRRINEEAQRQQMIGSILGIGGTITGAILGGPAGAVVGGSVGSQVGNSSGGGGGMGSQGAM